MREGVGRAVVCEECVRERESCEGLTATVPEQHGSTNPPRLAPVFFARGEGNLGGQLVS